MTRIERMNADKNNQGFGFQIRINPPNPPRCVIPSSVGPARCALHTVPSPQKNQCLIDASSATLSLNINAKNSITTSAKPAGSHQNWFHCGSDSDVAPGTRKRL